MSHFGDARMYPEMGAHPVAFWTNASVVAVDQIGAKDADLVLAWNPFTHKRPKTRESG